MLISPWCDLLLNIVLLSGTHIFNWTLTDLTECSGKVSDSSLVITDLDRQAVLPRCSSVRTYHHFKNELRRHLRLAFLFKLVEGSVLVSCVHRNLLST